MKNPRICLLTGWLHVRNAPLAGLMALGLALSAPARAETTLTVNDLGDPGANTKGNCTLRDALNVTLGNSPVKGDTCASNHGEPYIINITPTGTISLSKTAGPLPAIDGVHATINGPRVSPGVTIDANTFYGVLLVKIRGVLSINDLTIADGHDEGENSGGITSHGLLYVTDCTFSGNSTSGIGGGAIIVSDSIANIVNSTFSNNNAPAAGGAIFSNGGAVTVVNSTIYDNNSLHGGAIAAFLGRFDIESTILANSIGGNCGKLELGIIENHGHNVSDDDTCGFGSSKGASGQTLGDNISVLPAMATLGANGGPTKTFALQAGSAAIDAIPFASCKFPYYTPNPCTSSHSIGFDDQLTCDQRGAPRPDPEDGPTGPCDIGAYEFRAPSRASSINCDNAAASAPNLTGLSPRLFLPEDIQGVTDPLGPFTIKITGVTQDRPVTGGPMMCKDAFLVGDTAFVRDDDGPGKGGRSYEIRFKATDKRNPAVSCTGKVPVCVQGSRNAGKPCQPTGKSFVSTSWPVREQ